METIVSLFSFVGGWEWADGTPVDYVYWENGEPNGLERGENCAEMYDERYGKWNDEDCLAGAGYVCSIKQCKLRSSCKINFCLKYILFKKKKKKKKPNPNSKQAK